MTAGRFRSGQGHRFRRAGRHEQGRAGAVPCLSRWSSSGNCREPTVRCSAAFCRRRIVSGRRGWSGLSAIRDLASTLTAAPGSPTYLFSAERVAKGFVCAIVVGVPVGIAIGWNRISRPARSIRPCKCCGPIPITAWLPFSIAVFGIQDLRRDLPDFARRVLSDRHQHQRRVRATSSAI